MKVYLAFTDDEFVVKTGAKQGLLGMFSSFSEACDEIERHAEDYRINFRGEYSLEKKDRDGTWTLDGSENFEPSYGSPDLLSKALYYYGFVSEWHRSEARIRRYWVIDAETQGSPLIALAEQVDDD